MPKDLEKSILAALRRLPLQPGISDSHLEFHAHMIEYAIGTVGVLGKQSTPKQALKELKSVLQALKMLEKVEGSLSDLAWGAIDNAERKIVGDSNPSRLATLMTFQDYFVRGKYAQNMHTLEHASKRLSQFGNVPQRGRKPNERARKLARGLATTYFDLTGKRPTRSTDPYADPPRYYGPFVDFVRACFDLADVTASADEYARFAAQEFAAKGQKSN